MKKIDIACIIDDDPIFVFGAKRIMELANFCNNFLIFHNGKDALETLKPRIEHGRLEDLPEIILLDINMPIMDGWEFLDEFVKIPLEKEIRIYIVTSSIDPADTKKAEEYNNITNYIVKPITIDKLREILEEM
tara:strand:- start:2913 stop:3311 length:399 start_codon:yes stop_codon:yes gene_type:complete